MKILIATHNHNKYNEFKRLLNSANIEAVNLNDLKILNKYEEETSSFLDNAIGKAYYYSEYTDLITIGDDSGLVIPELGGFPGIQSSRFGEGVMTQTEKNKFIIEKMKDMKGSKRIAYFVCALAAVQNKKILFVSEERVRGVINTEEKGDSGFGYDPIFLHIETGKTFAEMLPSEKDKYSHRGKVIQNFINYIKSLNH